MGGNKQMIITILLWFTNAHLWDYIKNNSCHDMEEGSK